MQAMKDHKDFDNWYKTKITENDQDPPEGAWQNIADELDVNDVWNRISVELDSPRGWSASKAIYYSIPVLLLFLFSGGAYYYFNRTSDLTPIPTHLAAEVEEVKGVEEVEDARNVGDDIQDVPKVGGDTEAKPRSSETLVVGDGNEKKTATAETLVAGNVKEENPATTETLVPRTTETLVPRTTETLVAGHDNEEKTARAETLVAAKAETLVPRTTETIIAGHGEDIEHLRKVDDVRIVGHDNEEKAGKAETLAAEGDSKENPATTGTFVSGTTETLVTTPSKRLIAAARNHAGIATVIVPDSMLSIYPVTVTLHPDSLGWFAVAEAHQKLMYEKTIEFGLTASVKNTWLLNRMTLLGLERHTLNTTVPDFGKDIGMAFAYNFSRAFSAQAEGMFISEAGQRYKEYRNGKYVDREADLRYYTLNLLLKYNRNRVLLLNGHTIVGGLYASRLNQATETINGRVSQSSAYEDYNYGVIFGYEYNRFVMPNLVVTSGLRVSYGFPNIDERLFSKTFTGSFDLNVAVKYRFKGR
jgi:hypothetical protein